MNTCNIVKIILLMCFCLWSTILCAIEKDSADEFHNKIEIAQKNKSFVFIAVVDNEAPSIHLINDLENKTLRFADAHVVSIVDYSNKEIVEKLLGFNIRNDKGQYVTPTWILINYVNWKVYKYFGYCGADKAGPDLKKIMDSSFEE